MAEPKFLDQYRERLRVKHYSLRTEDAYPHWTRRFICFPSKRHPTKMRGAEVGAWSDPVIKTGCVHAARRVIMIRTGGATGTAMLRPPRF